MANKGENEDVWYTDVHGVRKRRLKTYEYRDEKRRRTYMRRYMREWRLKRPKASCTPPCP